MKKELRWPDRQKHERIPKEPDWPWACEHPEQPGTHMRLYDGLCRPCMLHLEANVATGNNASLVIPEPDGFDTCSATEAIEFARERGLL